MQGVVNNSGHDSYRRAGKTRPAGVVHVTFSFNNTNYVMHLKYRTTPKGLSSHLLLRDQSDNHWQSVLQALS